MRFTFFLVSFSLLLLSGCSRDVVAPTDNAVVAVSPTPSSALIEQSPQSTIEGAERKIVAGESLTKEDIAGIAPAELRTLRNTVFARHGRVFQTQELNDHFKSRSWYTPNSDYSDEFLTLIDSENVNLIRTAEGSSNAETTANSENIELIDPYTVPIELPGIEELKEANKEFRETWSKIGVECGDYYYWRKTPVGSGAVFYFQAKGGPVLSVNGEYIEPRELTEAQKLNGVDPQPIQWKGSGSAMFKVGRMYTCTGNCAPTIGWQDNYEIKIFITKVKGKWKLNTGGSERFVPMKCSDLPK